MNDLEDKKMNKITKHRDLFLSIIHSQSSIQDITVYEDTGDMSFVIPVKDIGLSFDDVQKYHSEIFSHFVVDFIGELLVRENLNAIVPHLTAMSTDLYLKAVTESTHQRFGMKLEKGNLFFKFHISLLQRILTEDFKNN